MKLIEKDIGRALFGINPSITILVSPPRIIKIKAKICKQDLNNFKSFSTAKEMINKMKDNPHNGKNICKCCNQQRINLQNIQTAHGAQSQKSKQPNQKVGRRSK